MDDHLPDGFRVGEGFAPPNPTVAVATNLRLACSRSEFGFLSGASTGGFVVFPEKPRGIAGSIADHASTDAGVPRRVTLVNIYR